MSLELTAEQIAKLRKLLAVPDGEPDPTGDDVLVCLAAQQIVNAESDRWHDLS